uniref:Selenoprotein K n=1 Tax=Leptobrachium leishanense TaxID=445787 RepID=A0A8C5WK95_9ANUR
VCYCLSGQVLEGNRSPWRLSFISDLFWGIADFVVLFMYQIIIYLLLLEEILFSPSARAAPPPPPISSGFQNVDIRAAFLCSLCTYTNSVFIGCVSCASLRSCVLLCASSAAPAQNDGLELCARTSNPSAAPLRTLAIASNLRG